MNSAINCDEQTDTRMDVRMAEGKTKCPPLLRGGGITQFPRYNCNYSTGEHTISSFQENTRICENRCQL